MLLPRQGQFEAVVKGNDVFMLEDPPVTTLNILLTRFGGAIMSFSTFISVVRGNPLSIISSRSCQATLDLHREQNRDECNSYLQNL